MSDNVLSSSGPASGICSDQLHIYKLSAYHEQTGSGNQNHSDQYLENFYKSVSYIEDCLNNCLDRIGCSFAYDENPALSLADVDWVSSTLGLLEQQILFNIYIIF